ncbi:class I SAM-dependent methyltransferase [Nodularia sp. UHCC 0506]|uniref:class I SAM-dependent methyltransferase n=1 Tax=Nodularia sp. UHCC 0506 TaxID=3110243 RepID=UPI002B20D780|nr:class I SAM-dependent methyltransferase [Nodularia sp. UHCC 0506]MEA5513692.1 class I SAM-dependent methyltransferase [Nodularia sp. UHCC 0506]
MEVETVLDRINHVYQESRKLFPETKNEQDTENKVINVRSQSMYTRQFIELDGNYLLYFNDIYISPISKVLKNLLKKLTWHILKRQISFNSAVKEVLYNLIQENHETSVKNIELNEKLTQLAQKVESLPNLEEISAKLNSEKSVVNQILSIEEAKIASGLWFNEPIIVGYQENGAAYWAGTNERILEKSFVLQSLARLYDSSNITILDVGSAESLLPYELASLNYSVTAIDIRPIALFHPNLKFVKTDICKPVFSPASFDCIIALSTLEHIGLGWYGDEVGVTYDVEAVKQIHNLLKPEGNFIFTVPYGKKALTPVHRIYDKEALQRLTQSFNITQISYGIRKDYFTWTMTENELDAAVQEHHPNNYLPGAVAMLVCKKTL